MFHATLGRAAARAGTGGPAEYGVHMLGLTGGVFQNRVLCERVLSGAAARRLHRHHSGEAALQRCGLELRPDRRGERAVMIEDQFVTLAHGNGGRFMRELIERSLRAISPTRSSTFARTPRYLPLPPGEVLITTDGFTVQPLEFPGGDIGSLAVHGTVNDLAVAGATPALSEPQRLHRGGPRICAARSLDRQHGARRAETAACGLLPAIPRSCAAAKAAASILRRPASAFGRPGLRLGIDQIRRRRRDPRQRPGRRSRHGGAAGAGGIRADGRSCFPTRRASFRSRRRMLDLPGLRFMRDPTRGGLVTVMHDIARATGLIVWLEENAIPVHPPVRGVCEMLGYDPLYLACEGRVVAVLSPDDAHTRWRFGAHCPAAKPPRSSASDEGGAAGRAADRHRRRTPARRTRRRSVAANLLRDQPCCPCGLPAEREHG